MRNSNYLYLILALILVLGSSFVIKENNNHPDEMGFSFVKTISNEQLNTTIENNFCVLIDNVKSIEAFTNSELGSYYVVSGEKDAHDVKFSLKVTENEIQNETYTYIDFESLIANGIQANLVDYCHWNFNQTTCLYYNQIQYPICGVRAGGKCVLW